MKKILPGSGYAYQGHLAWSDGFARLHRLRDLRSSISTRDFLCRRRWLARVTRAPPQSQPSRQMHGRRRAAGRIWVYSCQLRVHWTVDRLSALRAQASLRFIAGTIRLPSVDQWDITPFLPHSTCMCQDSICFPNMNPFAIISPSIWVAYKIICYEGIS